MTAFSKWCRSTHHSEDYSILNEVVFGRGVVLYASNLPEMLQGQNKSVFAHIACGLSLYLDNWSTYRNIICNVLRRRLNIQSESILH